MDKIVKGDLKICDHLNGWYGDEYDFTEAEVRYNTFNGRFYIYARMRKKGALYGNVNDNSRADRIPGAVRR